MIRQLTAVITIYLATISIGTGQTQTASQIGDIYEIVRLVDTIQKTSDGSSGSSHDKATLIERVIGMGADGLELEYDLPKATAAADRAKVWQFPVRVFKHERGYVQLLNRPELEMRIDAWLKLANLPRTACGRWIFTWTAIHIECDPQSVIQSIAPFDLRPEELQNGGMYQDPKAQAPAPISQKAVGTSGSTFVVEMIVDPDEVLREQAQSDVVVAELTGKKLTLDTALKVRSAEKISGTISISFETDSIGQVRRRTKITRIEIRRGDGKTETQTTTETVERRLVHN